MNKSPLRTSIIVTIAAAGVYSLVWCGHASCEQKQSTNVTRPGARLVVPLTKKSLSVMVSLPGELRAFRDVAIHAKVEGFISWIGVDRGSIVRAGQPMIKVSCPELEEKVREAEAKRSAAESTLKEGEAHYQSELERLSEAKTKFEADNLTATRLLEANKTPGAVAQNEVDQAIKKTEADQSTINAIAANVKAVAALIASQKENIHAAEKVVNSIMNMKEYLTIKAPFNGVITERNVHEGSIVAVESSRSGEPLVRVQERHRLRLVVAVPESAVSDIVVGRSLNFTVPAYPSRRFVGVITRPGFALDRNTRTMPVELDVNNSTGELQPGMYAKVDWKQTRSEQSLFAPMSSVGSDLRGSFVIVVRNGHFQRIPVSTGIPMNTTIEVQSDALGSGDLVLLRADDQIESISPTEIRVATEQEIKTANSRMAPSGE